jgi:hypothetical protein
LEKEMAITKESERVFLRYAKDAGNWGGLPLVDGNPKERGNLTQLKKEGLITTFRDEGNTWLDFTAKGREFAATLGVIIY